MEKGLAKFALIRLSQKFLEIWYLSNTTYPKESGWVLSGLAKCGAIER